MNQRLKAQFLYAPADDNGTPPPDNNTSPPAGVMPEGLPETFWDADARAVKLPDLIASYGEAATFKQQHDERIAALPKKPDEYKIEMKLPEGFKPPEGIELKVDEKDARIPLLRDFALKNQLSQEALSELVGLDAQYRVAQYQQEEAALQAEMAKLGENGPQRVTAVETFLKDGLKLPAAEYDAMRGFLADASAFAGLEKLIARATAQQVPGNTPPGNQQKPTTRLADRFYPQQKAN